MNSGSRSIRPLILLAILLFARGLATHAQTIDQSFELQPGWNAVWLEVDPTNRSPSAVFAGLPLESAWTHQARQSSVEFIENPNETIWNRSSWRVFVPTNRVESFQNNLFAIHSHRPYLLHVTNTAPITWTVSGTPSARPLEWVPNAYNLVGFPVDSGLSPSFADFFRPSPAHFDSATGEMRRAYRLGADGQWTPVGAHEPVFRGVAYWVFSEGPSSFTAPLEIELSQDDGLNFAGSLTELPIRLRNLAGTTRQVLVTHLGPASRLAYYRFSTNSAETWPSLPANHLLTLPARERADLRLAIRRQTFTSTTHASILEIADDIGTLYRLPVTATSEGSLGTVGGIPPEEEAKLHAGLWVGTVTLNAVAEVNSGQLITNPVTRAVTRTGASTVPTPTRSEANLRILLHVDSEGVTRLLREVIQMWQDGTYTNDASGFRRTAEPGRHVLLTDDRLIGQFGGVALRDGVPVGRRISTVSYDFDSGTNTFLELSGLFAISSSVSGTLVVPETAPTNPFRHKYHPDHDNLDATFRNFVPEAYRVTRQIELTFTQFDPTGVATPDYGYNTLAGLYREQVSGLHKDDLHVSGVFRLSRVALTSELNQ